MFLNKIKSLFAKCAYAFFAGLFIAGFAPAILDTGQQVAYADHCASREVHDDSGNCIENPIFTRLRAIVTFLSAGVGIAVTIMVVVGGIQYIAAADNPQKLKAAKGRIANAIGGLFMWLLSSAILEWLIPGGVFL